MIFKVALVFYLGIFLSGCSNDSTPKANNNLNQQLTNHQGSFEFGVSPFDVWGPVCGLPGCWGLENNKNLVPRLMTGVSRVGSKLLIINDFHKGLTGFAIGNHVGTGADTLTQTELNDIASSARNIGQNNLILTTYIYSLDPVINSAFQGLWTSATLADFKKYLISYKTFMVAEAKRATKAGVDGLILNPGNYNWGFQGISYADIKPELQALVDAIKANFAGKVYLRGSIAETLGISTVVSGIDAFILEHQIEHIFASVPAARSNDLVTLKTAWKTYLTAGIWNKDINQLYVKGNVYISVLAPSYTGALQQGWVEPSADYPAGKYIVDEALQSNIYEALFQTINELPSIPMKGVITMGFWWDDNMYPTVWQRNDISHSIRNKQAETVFRKWQKIIK